MEKELRTYKALAWVFGIGFLLMVVAMVFVYQGIQDMKDVQQSTLLKVEHALEAAPPPSPPTPAATSASEPVPPTLPRHVETKVDVSMDGITDGQERPKRQHKVLKWMLNHL